MDSYKIPILILQIQILLDLPIKRLLENSRSLFCLLSYYLYLLHCIPLDLNSLMSMSIDLSMISSLVIYTIFL